MRNDSTSTNNSQQKNDSSTGDVVRVVFVQRQDAKTVKTRLEVDRMIHRNFRIANNIDVNVHSDSTINNDTDSTNDTTASRYDDDGITKSHLVALPLLATSSATDKSDCNTMEQLLSKTLTEKGIQHTFGYQYCQYCSALLGNNNRQKIHRLSSVSSSLSVSDQIENNSSNKTTIVQSILINAMTNFVLMKNSSTIQQYDDADNNDKHSNDSTNKTIQQRIRTDVLRLSMDACPKKLELLGDDHTVVIPSKAFQYNDEHTNTVATTTSNGNNLIPTTNGNVKAQNESNSEDNLDTINNNSATAVLSFRQFLQLYGILDSTILVGDEFMNDYIWKEIAVTYQSHRIVRRNGVDPDSPIRQSSYEVVWYDPNYYKCTASTSSNNNDYSNDIDPVPKQHQSRPPQAVPQNWITVTEQGIHQSFDMTKLMFSRGNISEKIRFGTRLVHEHELVLDMYAGIGYFTLPALIKGKAQHVYCCEWNPDAIIALRYNLNDNHVSDRAIILEGDCRVSIREKNLYNKFDRISLGLLPSSEGGWQTAVLALRSDIGGCLHIHGNVPTIEVEQWSKWLCQRLHEYVRMDTGKNTNDWITLIVHVEKVKSFAPKINHYVADVLIGPSTRFVHGYTTTLNRPSNASKTLQQQFERFQQSFENRGDGGFAGVVKPNGCIDLCSSDDIPTIINPPSCALSPDGPLHQTWMK